VKIGLIFPNKDRKDKAVHLGLGYLASYARTIHHGLSFSILDTRIARKAEKTLFFETRFDLIGITVLSPVYYEVMEIVNHLSKNKKGTPICLGGPYVTTIMEEIFKYTPVDFAVYGEGEITFSELIFYLKKEKSIEEINGLMYKSQSGKIVTNPPRDQINEIDKLPIPAYDLFHMERYPMHRIVTSRGCPYKCVFCNSSSIWLGKWRERNPEDVVEEIKFLIKNYKRKTFFFNDNSFNIDMERVEAFCNSLINNKINILWTTPVRADKITKSLARLMKKSGCYNVGIGIESANNQILNNIQKESSIENMQKGINIFKNAGIEVLGQFVIGSPGDTIETIKESLEFAKKSNLDFVMFYTIIPFMHTEQWDYINSNGVLYSKLIHDYHDMKHRIIFETPEFPYKDRLTAITIAKELGYYSDSNNKNIFFDIGKDIARKFQEFLPESIGNKMYLIMKSIYRKKMWKN